MLQSQNVFARSTSICNRSSYGRTAVRPYCVKTAFWNRDRDQCAPESFRLPKKSANPTRAVPSAR